MAKKLDPKPASSTPPKATPKSAPKKKAGKVPPDIKKGSDKFGKGHTLHSKPPKKA